MFYVSIFELGLGPGFELGSEPGFKLETEPGFQPGFELDMSHDLVLSFVFPLL